MSAITIRDRPKLRRGVRLAQSQAHGDWVVLAPERVLQTDAVGAEILKLCDGERTVEAIIAALSARFASADIPAARIAADVTAYLQRLAEGGSLELVK